MKTFIFLFILIIAFFAYIFTANNQNSNHNEQLKPVMQQPTLEVLEESILNKSIDIPKADNQDNRNDIFISGSESSDTDSLYKLSTPSIPENMTFDRFKALLVQINPYYPQSAITLDLPLSSVIRTPKEKEQFRKKVKQNFHLSETQINYLMKENKLIWDWINLLR